MAPPEAQWMLWAKRLKDEHKILLHRIDSATQQIQDLASGPADLQAENNALRERIVRLEADAGEKEQRMVKLEQDAAELKQKMPMPDPDAANRAQAVGSEIQTLKERITALDRELSRTADAVRDWQEPARIPREDGDEQPPRPRSPHDPAAVAVSTDSTPRPRADMPPHKPHLGRAVGGTGSPRPRSQASTGSDSGTGTATRGAAREAGGAGAGDSIGIASQGAESLEAYLEYGDASVVRALRLYETRAVKAFVSGMREKSRQARLWDLLTEQGWTWQNARVGMRMLLDERRRRRR